MQRSPDRDLIELAREGSHEAAGALFDRYWPFAWRAAYAVTLNRTLADDAAQEAIGRAFASLARFDTTRPFGPWLKRIAVNCAIDLLRDADRRNACVDSTQAELELGAVAAADAADVTEVVAAVAALSPAKRAVVALRYWLGLPFDEIAGVLGLPVGTVASRHSRALDELRETLGEEHRVA
jgi:RNA polymerase sigma-70 factor (ECF subfamily)